MDHAKSLHYVGAGVAFPAGLLFVCLQCVLTYRLAVTALDHWMAHVRVSLALGAMVSLVLSILQTGNWSWSQTGLQESGLKLQTNNSVYNNTIITDRSDTVPPYYYLLTS